MPEINVGGPVLSGIGGSAATNSPRPPAIARPTPGVPSVQPVRPAPTLSTIDLLPPATPATSVNAHDDVIS